MTIEKPAKGRTFERVRALVADHLAIKSEEIRPESRIVEDLGADSLDLAELVLVLEEALGTEIPEDEAQKLVTVGDIAAFGERVGARNDAEGHISSGRLAIS